MSQPMRFGGSFAPALTDAKLLEYNLAFTSLPREAKDAVDRLLTMFETLQNGPVLEVASLSQHKSERGVIQKIKDFQEGHPLWEAVPWKSELDAMNTVFEQLPPGPARNGAYHLLWYARELDLDRVPMTLESL